MRPFLNRLYSFIYAFCISSIDDLAIFSNEKWDKYRKYSVNKYTLGANQCIPSVTVSSKRSVKDYRLHTNDPQNPLEHSAKRRYEGRSNTFSTELV